MFRRSKKTIAILTILTFLMTLLPMGTAMAASTGYTALQVPAVDDGADYKLGSVRVEFPAGQIRSGDQVTFRLPDDFIIRDDKDDKNPSAMDVVYGNQTPSTVNYIEVPKLVNGDNNGLYSETETMLDVEQLDGHEFKVSVPNTFVVDSGLDVAFIIHFDNVYVDSGFDGDITFTADSMPGSGFTSGSVVIGRVTGGDVTVSVNDVPSFSDYAVVKLRIKEDRAGAIDGGDESLKFTLPDGFVWDDVIEGTQDEVNNGTADVVTGNTVKTIWGGTKGDNLETIIESGTYKYDIDKDELTINLPPSFATGDATCIELAVRVVCDDETDAELGDVVVNVSGDSDVSPSELTVAKYGQFETTIEAKDAPTIFAGKLEQEIGKIAITESIKQSLVNGRTIILTLPANAKWGKVDTDDDSGVGLKFAGFPGTDGRSAKWTVDGNSSDAAELELSDMEVALEPGVTGDLKVEVSGTAGLTGELVVAKVVSPVTITAASTPSVKIGTVSEAGDLTITEAAGGAIDDDKDIILDLPQGVRFASAPKVEVIEGDLDIDEDNVKTQKDGEEDDNQVAIPVDGKSVKASSIKVTGIKYVVDRTVAEGDITIKVKGAAVADVNDAGEVDSTYDITDGYVYISANGSHKAFYVGEDDKKYALFDKTTTAAKTVNAVVSTPAPGDSKANATFVLGDTKYTVNGVEQTMDVAAYAKNGRTYLPIRYVGLALGVNADNILWDGKTATLIKGDRVVQVTKGSTALLINGATITMDAAPEIVNGRTMLPLRWIAQAMGASVSFDETTKTVSIN